MAGLEQKAANDPSVWDDERRRYRYWRDKPRWDKQNRKRAAKQKAEREAILQAKRRAAGIKERDPMADPDPLDADAARPPKPSRRSTTPRSWDRGWRKAFLKAYSVRPIIASAAAAAGTTANTVHRTIKADPAFAEKFAEARQIAKERLVSRAWEIAVDGIEEPIYFKGEVVGHRLAHSEKMLEVLLKGFLPEMFNDRLQAAQVNAQAIGDLTEVRRQLLRQGAPERFLELVPHTQPDGSVVYGAEDDVATDDAVADNIVAALADDSATDDDSVSVYGQDDSPAVYGQDDAADEAVENDDDEP